MAKAKIVFFCSDCGADTPKWQGRCPACGQWNTLVEQAVRPAPARGEGGGGGRGGGLHVANPPLPITEIPPDEGRRFVTGLSEFDRILGGGLVEGSATLLGGEPGVGKSTLMLQVAYRLAAGSDGAGQTLVVPAAARVVPRGSAGKGTSGFPAEAGTTNAGPAGAEAASGLQPTAYSLNGPVLYVTGEESARQTRMRAERLGAFSDRLFVQCETDVEEILATLERMRPSVVVVDSVQTLCSADVASAPGGVAQIRESAAQLVRAAKASGIALFFIGHVTKDGVVAGPRLLEHMVDTVLYFEGERHFSFRILRCVKNRFGSTNEIGIFEMTEAGLTVVENPSEMFLSERPEGTSGSVVLAALEGTRTLLVEVQALASPGGGFGPPRRAAHGMDAKRLALILAVLEKRVGLPLATHDVFVNIAGGLSIEEPALDLAVAAAVASSARNRPLERGVVVFGEIGLAGEVRSVGQIQKRFNEARRLGFEVCVYGAPRKEKPRKENGLTLCPASTLEEAFRFLGLGES